MKIKILKGQPDLHNRLIREIQDKSLERSRKDSTIRFDDRGNLINNEGMSDNILCFNSKLMVCSEKGPSINNRMLFSPLAQQDEEEHDGLNELISISQAPSVPPTLERRVIGLNR